MTSRYYVLAADVRIRMLDDDALVFNPFSWETHLLNPAAALVLDVAAAAPCSEDGIRDVLAEVLDERQRPQAAEHARHLLKELVGLRLLVEQPVAPDANC